MDVANLMADTYYPTLFCLITGLLSTTLMGTYKLTAGIFDGYTAMIVPGALLFFFNISSISDTLAIATGDVGDAVWGSPWTEEGVPVRRSGPPGRRSAPSQCRVLRNASGSEWLPSVSSSAPASRMVLNMITRSQKPSAARVPFLGNVDLPSFKDAMNQWYSFLQLIRSLNG